MVTRFHPPQNEAGHATAIQHPSVGAGHYPAAPATLSALLARHLIEEELLQQYPRWIRSKNSSTVSSLLYTLCGSLWMFSLLLLKKSPTVLILLPIIPSVASVALSLFALRQQKSTTQLLRYGKAYPAVIEYIGTGCRFRDSTVGIAYWYQDGSGNVVRRISYVGSHLPHFKNLNNGDTFTLLVSPDNENDVLPYFTVPEDCIVPVEATQISHDVSARIAARIATQPTKFVRNLGTIEPELLGTTPREVRMTRKQISKILWVIGTLPIVFLIVELLFAKVLSFWKESWIYLLFFGPLIASQIPNPFVTYKRHVWWLKKGTPTRAVVVDEFISPSSAVSLEDQTASFIYEYETFAGEKVTGNVKFSRRNAWQLSFAKGTAFTVIYNREIGTDHIPYFQISDAEIVGAMGAKITPP